MTVTSGGTHKPMKIPESLYSWANEKNIGSEAWKNRTAFVKQCEAFPKMADALQKLTKLFYNGHTVQEMGQAMHEAREILRESGVEL